MTLESIKELAQKVKRLAEEGASAGEKQAASAALERLLTRHKLTLDDINDEVKFTYRLKIGKDLSFTRRLWMQIIQPCARSSGRC